MFMWHLRNTLFSLTLFVCFTLKANEPGNFVVEQYDNRAGLSNSAITNIYIDKNGLLWIGTWDGLNYYDGYTFQHVNYARPEKNTGVSNNVIQNITDDSNGTLWITTIGGISNYHKQTGVIDNYFYSTISSESISEHEYGAAISSNAIYVFTANKGLMLYSPDKKTFLPVTTNSAYGKPLKILYNNNRLYILNTSKQLFSFKATGTSLVQYGLQEGITDCFATNNRLFLISVNRQLSLFENGRIVKTMPVHDEVNAISFYNNSYMIAWREKGFSVYDTLLNASLYMSNLVKDYSEMRITAFSNNSGGTLWMGTDGNGILKIISKPLAFGTINFSSLNIPYNVPVRAFCRNGQDLWVGTKGKGIIVLKDFNPFIAPYNSHYTRYAYPAQIDNNSVYALKSGRNNLVYIGTDAEGINIFNKNNNQFYRWKDINGSDRVDKFGSVYSIYEDPDSSLWLGTSGYGLIHIKFNLQKDKIYIRHFSKYTATGNAKGPVNNIIYSIAPGHDGHLWIGCRYGGLNLFNKKENIFKDYSRFADDKGLSNNDVLCVLSDSKNNVWVGTSHGLNLLSNADKKKEDINPVQFTTENGLPNNTIHGIVEADGDIWISTNKGLAKILPDYNIINYQESDGLQSSEFSDCAVWKDADNSLFFGGIAGFNNFDAAAIKQDTYLPNILITGQTTGGVAENTNKLSVITSSWADVNTLNKSVERRNNYFEVTLKAINYNNTAKCEIQYFLDGYDKTWHSQKAVCNIVYNNLPVGNYKLKVKWSNGEGIWSSEKELLAIKIKQYPWLTLPALMGYALLVLAIAYIIHKYRNDSIKEKHKLEKEKLERFKEEEIHRNRISFFTNIAHELQTPLTLVMGSFDRLLENAVDPSPEKHKTGFYQSLIQQQTAKLTYLLQQLFEFRKLETPYYQPHIDYLDITELLKNLAEPFVSIGETNQLNYIYQVQEQISGGIDKDKTEKIVYNLLSNAFKYTPKHENVLFEVDQQQNLLHILVYNSGVTLTEEQTQQLFDLFYTTNNKNTHLNKFGTGIGLAFTKQLTHLTGGKITVHNKNGGVCFEVWLPIKQDIAGSPERENHQPSYLYNILTRPDKPFVYNPTTVINKHTVINSIIEENKDIIVIAEDEKEIRYLLRDILKNSYHVYEAENGVEGLSLVHQHKPALVISDVVMADMNGLQLCDAIKNTNAICHIPVILLSAKNAEEQHMEGYNAGADAYISKPFKAGHLLLRVRKLIEYRKKMQALMNEQATLPNVKTLGLETEDEKFLTKLYEVVQENIINPDLNAQFLERQLCISHMQLYRKLKSLSGMTPNEFIKNTRLVAAAQLLQSTKHTVADIFYQTGFNNQSYFFREFKKKYGVAPNEYREKFSQKFSQ